MHFIILPPKNVRSPPPIFVRLVWKKQSKRMVNAFVTQFILIRNYIEHKKEEEEEGDGESKKHTHTHTEFGSYEYGATNPK